jgi:hypothetical protein
MYPRIIKPKITNPHKGFWIWVQISLSPEQAVTSSALRVVQDMDNNDPAADLSQLTEGDADGRGC